MVPGGLAQSLGAPETPRAEASRAAPAEHPPRGLGVSLGACGPAGLRPASPGSSRHAKAVARVEEAPEPQAPWWVLPARLAAPRAQEEGAGRKPGVCVYDVPG